MDSATLLKKIKEQDENKGNDTWNTMCIHMQALVKYCESSKVFFGGCGDCGSPWLTCGNCNKSVDDASSVFDRRKE